MCSPPQLSICGELFTQRTLYPCYPGYCPAWAAFRAWLLLPSPGEREKEPPLLLFRSHSIFPLANGAQTGEEKREKVGFFGVGVDGGREKEELWANKNTPGSRKGEGEKSVESRRGHRSKTDTLVCNHTRSVERSCVSTNSRTR